MSDHQQDVNTLLEKTADYIDALEAENRRLAAGQQTIHAERVTADADKLAAQVLEATGEAMDTSLARKIAAHADGDVRELLHKLAAPEEADGMGQSRQSRTKVAGTGDEAWDKFGAFLES